MELPQTWDSQPPLPVGEVAFWGREVASPLSGSKKSLAGYSPQGLKESDMTERLNTQHAPVGTTPPVFVFHSYLNPVSTNSNV